MAIKSAMIRVAILIATTLGQTGAVDTYESTPDYLEKRCGKQKSQYLIELAQKLNAQKINAGPILDNLTCFIWLSRKQVNDSASEIKEEAFYEKRKIEVTIRKEKERAAFTLWDRPQESEEFTYMHTIGTLWVSPPDPEPGHLLMFQSECGNKDSGQLGGQRNIEMSIYGPDGVLKINISPDSSCFANHSISMRAENVNRAIDVFDNFFGKWRSQITPARVKQ